MLQALMLTCKPVLTKGMVDSFISDVDYALIDGWIKPVSEE